MSKELVGALVAVALVAPYLIGSSAQGLMSASRSVLLRIGIITAYLASVGLFVAMGFKGGDTFHSSFWGYWLIGGYIIWSTLDDVVVVFAQKPSKPEV